jgi:hypothetical protein
MKNLYLFIVVLFVSASSYAGQILTAISNKGNWNEKNTWNSNRIPNDGDTVIIPVGKEVVVNRNQNHKKDQLVIIVKGTLDLTDKGKLFLGDNSQILVYGQITGHGKNSSFIKIGDNEKFSGTEYAITGYAYADASTGVSPSGFKFGGTILPVKFVDFSVIPQSSSVLIRWSTAQETNSSYFEIQRSENGNDWVSIATVTAAGNSTVISNYSYTDRKTSAAQVMYYRIKQVDLDGQFTMTAVRTIKMQQAQAEVKVSAAGNNTVLVNFSQQVKSNVVIRLTSMTGQVISQQLVSNPAGQITFSAHNSLTGVYVVTISNGSNLMVSKQVLL